MLQTQTVESRTFSLLKELMAVPELGGFLLVGGTALSLLYGHRQSIDIDLFSEHPFDYDLVAGTLQMQFGSQFVLEDKPRRFGIFCNIDGIKVDLVYYPHPHIRPDREISGIRFISTEDIAAMKVQAVLGRARKKDFWDIAALLEHFAIADFIDFHKQKYNTQNLLITVPQAISYFIDAEDDADPKSMNGQTWEMVKSAIQGRVRRFLA